MILFYNVSIVFQDNISLHAILMLLLWQLHVLYCLRKVPLLFTRKDRQTASQAVPHVAALSIQTRSL